MFDFYYNLTQMAYFRLAVVLAIVHAVLAVSIQRPQVLLLHPSLSTVQANVTVPVNLPVPHNLTSVVWLQIKQGSQYCHLAEVKPTYSIGPILDIDSMSSVVNNRTWDVQIMSFAYSPQTNKIYTLLDNGTIIQSQFDTNSTSYFNTTPSKQYTFESIGNTQTWLTTKHQIFVLKDSLYLLKDETFSNLELHPMGYWNAGNNPLLKGVLKAQIKNDTINVLTNQEFSIFDSRGNQVLKVTGGTKYVDFYIAANSLFILDAEKGLISRNLLTPTVNKVFDLPELENVVKIRGFNRTLFAIYQIQHRNYLAQYFIINDQLVLNRYYHNYYVIKDIHPSTNYAILDSYNEFILLHHSINRLSFQVLTPIEHLYKSYGVKVVDVLLLNDSETNLSMVVALKSSIFKLTFTPHHQVDIINENFGLNSQYVQCQSDSRASITVQVIYKGVCSSRLHESTSYACTVDSYNQVTFQYSHEARNQRHNQNRLIFILIFFVVATFSVLLILAARHKLKKKQEQFNTWRKKLTEKKEQNTANHEGTFNLELASK